MKKAMQLFLGRISLITLTSLLQGCPTHKMEVILLVSGTRGRWEWVRTTTPTRILTPQSVGYTRQLAVDTDSRGNYAAFYKNDTLQRRIYETTTDTNHTFVDTQRSTVLIKYGGAGYISYLVANTGNSTVLTVSEVLNPYSTQADTIHSVYTNNGYIVLYPY